MKKRSKKDFRVLKQTVKKNEIKYGFWFLQALKNILLIGKQWYLKNFKIKG